jgi:putative CocE/NonD family hydrolase
MRINWNVSVPMRDGVKLAADVYLADGEGARATVVARTPYNKNTAEQQQRAKDYARNGYNFVWIDVRGRGDSEGDFVLWRDEARDGYDAIEWVARQPWCDGQVITWGQSYLGYNQWLTALEQPPHLTAMIAYVPPSDPFEDNPTGVHIPWEICWLRMLDGRVMQYVDGVDWPEIAWHLPLMTMDERAGFHSEHWRRNLSHPVTDSGFWDPLRYQRRITEVRVPVLHITGWYDDVQAGTMTNFTNLTAAGAPEEVRRNQWLIVGPWDHRCTRTRQAKLGEITFGPGAETDLPALEREWLASVRGERDAPPAPAPVRIFVMGANEWRQEQEWPLARTRWSKYYLTSEGKANTRHGDGELRREEKPGDGLPPDVITYDPADPVPFLSDYASSSQIGGPDDYSKVEERDDVLVYTTSTLAEDLEVTGPVRMKLYASTTARDTDFTAKLLDVHPSGFSQRLCDGMVRARYRNGYDSEDLVTPGEILCYEIDMWSTSHVFLAGHRIRVEVSSSAFPKYDRNLNTGEALATGTEMVTATNSVWHTADQPSQLILPEIPARV